MSASVDPTADSCSVKLRRDMLPSFPGTELLPGDWNLVIKVKYDDTLKRFNRYVNGSHFDYNLADLRSMITHAYKFSPEDKIILTYTDEDGDVVTLDDDDDLRDAAISQKLNPLRIDVQSKRGVDDVPSKLDWRILKLNNRRNENKYKNDDTFRSNTLVKVPSSRPATPTFGSNGKINGDLKDYTQDQVCVSNREINGDQRTALPPPLSFSPLNFTFNFTIPSVVCSYAHYQEGCSFGDSYINLTNKYVSIPQDTLHISIQSDGCRVTPIVGPHDKSDV